jgi:hypothetical protein
MELADLDAPLIRLKGASWVTVSGLVLEGGLGDGVVIEDGRGCTVAGCDIRNLGRTGVVVRGGTGHAVRSCDIHDLGAAGITLAGGDRKTLTPGRHLAENNHIHRIGIRKKTYAAGVTLGGYGGGESVGSRVAHNLIHDLPHAGVLYSGNDNVLEFNEVYRVVLTSADMGAFYTWHDWTSRGNVLRHNLVYDSPRANAFYMDDGDSGDEVTGNIVHGCEYGPFIGGGHDNIVRGNIIVATHRALHLDSRGVPRGYDRDKGLLERLKATPYRDPPWSERYPSLVGLLEAGPALPRGNVLEGNVIVRCGQAVHTTGKPEELKFSTVGGNLDLGDADPFVDLAKADFRLREDSPVPAKLPGFKPIPVERIGLFVDGHRKTLPVRTLTHGPTGPKGDVFDSDTDVQRSNRKP